MIPLDTSGSTSEATVDDSVIDTESLENLGTLVGLKGGDTHLAHDLENTTIARRLVVVNDLLIRKLLADQLLPVHLENTLHGEVRIDGISTISKQNTHVVDLTSLGSFDDDGS